VSRPRPLWRWALAGAAGLLLAVAFGAHARRTEAATVPAGRAFDAICRRYCRRHCEEGPFVTEPDVCLSDCQSAGDSLAKRKQYACAAAAPDCEALWRCFGK
jgi:hypothetical protein